MSTATVTIRRLDAADLASVVAIDVRETDDVVLVQHAREVTQAAEAWSRPSRDAAAWQHHVATWQVTLAEGGAAWGAQLDGRLVGLIVLRRRVRPGTDQLQALFVDREARRRRIATALIGVLEAESRAGGAHTLVVSATPIRSAVGVYTRAGFTPTDDPVPELLALEPDDIHLDKATLTPPRRGGAGAASAPGRPPRSVGDHGHERVPQEDERERLS